MTHDPVVDLINRAQEVLTIKGNKILIEKSIHPYLRWTPHLYEPSYNRAWYCLSEIPENDAWYRRMLAATALMPEVSLGVVSPLHVLQNEEVLSKLDELKASVLPVRIYTDHLNVNQVVRKSACDLIYEERFKLSTECARVILDSNLDRTLTESNYNKKGILLEVLTAVLLSQVNGFEVAQHDISNRSQQIDVLVHNRNNSGILGNSPIVLAEAKNWTKSVESEDYSRFVRKLETRYSRCQLGFFVTTDRFSEGVYLETRYEAKDNLLVVLIDGEALPDLWRQNTPITNNIEKKIVKASIGR